MKLKNIFTKLKKEKIISDFSIYNDLGKEYCVIHLSNGLKIKMYYQIQEEKISFGIIENEKNKNNLNDLKTFINYFYNIEKKIKIDEQKYNEFIDELKYENKLKLLGINKKQAERIFVEGIIDIHPNLKNFAYNNGYIHLSVMSLSLKRPIIFKKINNVVFPIKFCIKGIDIVSPGNYNARFKDEFYLDCWYGKNVDDVIKNRGNVLGGEAWGKSGKPTPIKHGSNVKITINKFWTQELYDGGLKHSKNDFFSCWVDIQNKFKKYFKKKNKLILFINTIDINGEKKIIAKKEINNLSINDFPKGICLNNSDIVKSYKEIYIKNNKQIFGYVTSELIFYDNEGKISKIIKGGRASKATQIIISGLYGLKIILYKEKK